MGGKLARNVSPMQALEDELVHAVMIDTGLQTDMARFMVAPIIRHLRTEYGGDRLYIPKSQRIAPATGRARSQERDKSTKQEELS
jgi:hypothetical protein